MPNTIKLSYNDVEKIQRVCQKFVEKHDCGGSNLAPSSPAIFLSTEGKFFRLILESFDWTNQTIKEEHVWNMK